jgi:hypothetical protein
VCLWRLLVACSGSWCICVLLSRPYCVLGCVFDICICFPSRSISVGLCCVPESDDWGEQRTWCKATRALSGSSSRSSSSNSAAASASSVHGHSGSGALAGSKASAPKPVASKVFVAPRTSTAAAAPSAVVAPSISAKRKETDVAAEVLKLCQSTRSHSCHHAGILLVFFFVVFLMEFVFFSFW